MTGGPFEGRLSWSGSKLCFTPYHDLTPFSEYLLLVGTAAEDRFGSSLSEEFRAAFSTGDRGPRPGIEEVSPAAYSAAADRRTPIRVVFTEAVDRASLLEGFSVSPEIKGRAELSSDGRCFTFHPAENMNWQKEYEAVLSENILSARGTPLGEEFRWSFRIGTDRVPPGIMRAGSEAGGKLLRPSLPGMPADNENTGWEKDGNVVIRFSESIERKSAEASVSIEPPVPFSIAWDSASEPAGMIIRWDEALEWKQIYRLKLSTGIKDLQGNRIEDDVIYRLFVDGAGSRPPSLSRCELIPDLNTSIRLFDREAPSAGIKSHEILDTSGGDALASLFYIDYYIRLAEGAELPFFSLIENFNISPDSGCVSISYLDFQVFNPGTPPAAAAEPRPAPAPDEAVVRLICSLTDTKTASGMISFRIYRELEDSLGNSMPEDWTAEIFDEDN